MKLLTNKKLFKKILALMIILLIFGFCFSGHVEAKDDDKFGKLLKPIVDLILAINDGLYDIVHKVVLHQETTLLSISLTATALEVLKSIAIFVGVAIVAAVAIVATAGLATGLVTAIAGISLASISAGTVVATSIAAGAIAVGVYNVTKMPNRIDLPLYSISPEEIFSNKILLFDVDFFNPDESKSYADEIADLTKTGDKDNQEIKDVVNASTEKDYSTSARLRGVVSSWYVILRDISIVTLLSILVYIGIRIIISSTAADKSKYKEMLKDWVVAICLLFVMQYIMSFANILVEKVTDLLTGVNYSNLTMAAIPDKDGKISKALVNDYGYSQDQVDQMILKDASGNNLHLKDDDTNLIGWNTNLIGIARLNAQMAIGESSTYAGYAIIFAVLVLMTIFFIFTYIKRVIYMAFLTLIAPLVAMTYPLDKMNDGSAQAFNSWLKEYIFNLLIQPLHLLLYTIFVSSAFELASQNIIYSLVALAFIIPSEKLMRKFFGFDKAHTPPLLGGPVGAAATMSVMNKMLSKAPTGRKGGSGAGNVSASRDKNDSKIKYNDKINSDAILFGKNDNGEDSNILGAPSPKNPNGPSSSGGSGAPELPGPNGSNDNPNIVDGSYKEIPYSKEADYDFTKNEASGINNGPDMPNNNDDTIRMKNINDDGNLNNIGFENTSAYKGGKALGNFVGTHANNAKEDYKTAGKTLIRGVKKIGSPIYNSKPAEKFRNNKVVKAIGADAKVYGRTLAAGTKFYARGMKNKISDRIKNSHPIRNVAKVAGGVALGATAGTIGLAAGIVSGDPRQAIQFTGMGAGLGFKAGEGITQGAMNALSVDGIKDDIDRDVLGDEGFKEKKIRENIRSAQTDRELKENLERKVKDKQERKHIMNDVVPTAVRYGLNGTEDILTLNELTKGKNAMDTDTAISQIQLVKEQGKAISKMGHKEKKELNDTILMKFKENNKNATDEQNAKHAAELMSSLERTSKIYYNNKKD